MLNELDVSNTYAPVYHMKLLFDFRRAIEKNSTGTFRMKTKQKIEFSRKNVTNKN